MANNMKYSLELDWKIKIIGHRGFGQKFDRVEKMAWRYAQKIHAQINAEEKNRYRWPRLM